MKNLLLVGCLLAALPVAAQSKTKTTVKPGRAATPNVSAVTVSRVMRILAADDM